MPAAARLLPGVFYGWVIVAAAGLVSFVTVGIGFYGQTFLLDGLRSAHGWPLAQLAGASSVFFVVSAIVSPIVGWRIDRDGPTAYFIVGGCLLAASLAVVGWLDDPWQLYWVYPFMAVGFTMSSAIPASAIITRWFVVFRARAMAFSQSGVSLGGMLLVPLATWLINSAGIRFATAMLAAVVAVIVIPVTIYFLRSMPEDHGLQPDGQAPPHASQADRLFQAQYREWRISEVLRTRAFWLLCVAFSGILFAQVGVLVHELTLLRERLDLAGAALAFGLTPLGSALARIVVGLVADRLDRKWLAVGLFGFQALTLCALSIASGPWLLFLVCFLFGCTIGNIFMLQSLLVGEFFGMISFGSVYGLLQLATQVASGLGPFGLALLREQLGGYSGALWVLAAIVGLSALVLSWVSPPRPGKPPRQPAGSAYTPEV